MALSCAAECALSLACARWALRRLSLSGAGDSASWPSASPSSFAPVPHACRSALAAYDAAGPGHEVEPAPSQLCPPYRLTHDRARGEVVLAVRGLGLARLEDYRVILDAGGPEPFAGGHAHRGLLRAAVWLLDREGPAIRRMVAEAGPAGTISCPELRRLFNTSSDQFSEENLKHVSKLYAPGRVFHIVERENCRCGRLPPQVRTAVPADGRFEHVVLSCNATSDHGIIWIEKEAQKALD
ncbi:hypothetical protein E2562_001442, partial [Oryza meyeriana var. granulata]